MTLSAGTRLGPYEISSLLGAGGMGEVYRARDTRLGRDVAVKLIPGRAGIDPRLGRFAGHDVRSRRGSRAGHLVKPKRRGQNAEEFLWP